VGGNIAVGQFRSGLQVARLKTVTIPMMRVKAYFNRDNSIKERTLLGQTIT
jgi:hypothetical protein